MEESQEEARILNFCLKPLVSSLICCPFLNPKKGPKLWGKLSGLGMLGGAAWSSAIFQCHRRVHMGMIQEDV